MKQFGGDGPAAVLILHAIDRRVRQKEAVSKLLMLTGKDGKSA